MNWYTVETEFKIIQTSVFFKHFFNAGYDDRARARARAGTRARASRAGTRANMARARARADQDQG